MHFEKYPQEILDLQTELALPEHTEIREWLTAECVEMRKLETVLGMLAARLGILIEGHVLLTDVCKLLAEKLLERRRKAVPMIITGTADINEATKNHSGAIVLLDQARSGWKKPH